MKNESRNLKSKGITLVEVMIAVVVLSVATLGVMGALTFGIVSNDYAGTYSEANQAAREIVEGVRATQLAFEPTADAYDEVFSTTKQPLGDPPFDGSYVGGLPNLSNLERFERTVTATSVSDNLYRVEATVYWEMKGVEKKVTVVALARDTLGGTSTTTGGSGSTSSGSSSGSTTGTTTGTTTTGTTTTGTTGTTTTGTTTGATTTGTTGTTTTGTTTGATTTTNGNGNGNANGKKK